MGLGQGIYRSLVAKTADYKMIPQDLGKVITNRGAAGAITLTLPPVADIETGWHVDVFVVENQNFTVASKEGDNIVTKNDAAADSISFQTAANIIGAGARFVYDGTSWLCFLMTEGAVTVTIAT